jgi:hypothetical protein
MKVIRVNNLLPELPEIEVDIGSWRRSRGGILQTLGASTCVIAAVYLPEQATGYLGHFAALDVPEGLYHYQPQTDTVVFDEMIDAIGSSQAGSIEAWLGGGALAVARDLNSTLADRAYAERSFQELGVEPDKLIVDWETGLNTTDVLLDCKTGELLVQKAPRQ